MNEGIHIQVNIHCVNGNAFTASVLILEIPNCASCYKKLVVEALRLS